MKERKVFTSLILAGYLLGVRGGYLALWKDDCPEPVQVFPYQAQMLPEKDQKALRNGIHVTDEADLQRLLEDYLS